MTTILVTLLQLLSPSPRDSIKYAAWLVGDTRMERRQLAGEMPHIAWRESRFGVGKGGAMGVHVDDAGSSDWVQHRAAIVGWLRGHCTSKGYHRGGWSSRGVFGLMAAYNLRWLGVECAPPWVLDIPIVSAIAAARKHKAKCWKSVKVGPAHYVRELDPNGANRWCR